MGACTKATDETDAAGLPARDGIVLRPERLARHVRVRRHECHGAVAEWVEYYWSLRWDLPAGTLFVSQILPDATCSLTLEVGSTRPEIGDDPVVVTGVVTKRFDVDVRGSGRVLGVKFRPGGLAALANRGVGDLRDRVVPAVDVLGPDVAAMADLDPDAPARRWTASVGRLLARLGGVVGDSVSDSVHDSVDDDYRRVLTIVEAMRTDRDLLAVAQVAERFDMSVRGLQRLFVHYVGAGPKWVLGRFRMHDVVAELDRDGDASLTELAHRFGWYDQAHFTRDFTRLVGEPPGAYRARRAPQRPSGRR
ncbi:MAG: helix-turn-helix domain-containing protein [Ilumatobacteraceae bacterium]